jgi:hypothetical protein
MRIYSKKLICAGRFAPDQVEEWDRAAPPAQLVVTMKSWPHDPYKLFGNSMDSYGILFIFVPLHVSVCTLHSLPLGTGVGLFVHSEETSVPYH